MPEETDKRYQFLFVDDDQAFLTTLTSLLKQISKAHWAIRTANNHAQALEQLKGQPVDIVVLDVEMPVMDGVQFLRLMRHTHPNQRVVMLSEKMDETARKNSMELGAVLFLQKPNTDDGLNSLFAVLDALAAAGPQSGFRGVMQVGLHDVLQMECLARKSSILLISTGNRRGQIYVCDGEIIHAESGPLQGEMALYGLLGLSGGEFTLQPFAEPQRRSVSGNYEFLLMEAARLRDENSSQSPLSSNQNLYNSRSAAAAPRRDSRMADKLAGTKKHTGGAGRSKSMPRQKRHQAPSFKLVKIGRKLLHPRPRP